MQVTKREFNKWDKPLLRLHVVTIGAENHSPSFADNTHRVIVKHETETEMVGWPDPTRGKTSDAWLPGIDRPLTYPKFAWEVR